MAWIVALVLILSPSADSRVEFTINEGWRYVDGPLDDGAAIGTDDTAWERVDLPHTWNADDAFDKVPGYRRGIGWYRKRLELATRLAGRRLFLRFEGANQVAQVYVNGVSAGRHVGGYTGFTFEITGLVRFDRDNLIAVRVDNAHDDDIPPLDADFTFYGGIYRDVWLVATDLVHIDLLDYGSYGIFVDTPEVSAEAATVRVRGTIVNDSGIERRVAVRSAVLDPAGAHVTTLESDLTIGAGERATFEQMSRPVRDPMLWYPHDPNLYRVITRVVDYRNEIDRVESPLGFRWAGVDADTGFQLNGEPYRLEGTNRHQDRAGYANALPDAAHRRDVDLVKWTGFNFLRLAHYPQDPAVLEAADRAGLVVWEEVPVVNTITMTEAFSANAERMLREMIRQHYNHPSILIWGYMNEILLREPNPRPEGYRDSVLALGRRLERVVRAEDPFRLTATAISHGEVDNGTGFQDIPNILGMNLYFGWYYDEFDTFGTFLDDLHATSPERPLFISEYGAGSDERVHTTEPVRFDFSTDHAQVYHRSQFRIARARPYLVGTAVWNQFDFGSAGRQDTKNAINQKGLFFYDRTPKDVAYYYRAMLVDEPVLHVARETNRRAGSRAGDAVQTIGVYSNVDSVELLVNGRSVDQRRVENAYATWDVTLVPGRNRVVAVAGNVRDEVEYVFDDRTSFFDLGGAATEITVNAGSHYDYTDAFGVVWEADRAYESGSWGWTSGEPRLVHNRMLGTDDDPLFQAFRERPAYRFDVPDGRYELELGFVETRGSGSVFSVLANGDTVLTGVDLTSAAERWRTTRRRVLVEASGGLAFEFMGSVGTPAVSSIRLRRR